MHNYLIYCSHSSLDTSDNVKVNYNNQTHERAVTAYTATSNFIVNVTECYQVRAGCREEEE